MKRIFTEYLAGTGLTLITKRLNEDGVPSYTGGQWHHNTIRKILHNYTYTGNLLLQKTYRENHLTKKKLVNDGQYPKYHATETHEAIIDLETFDAVQAEIAHRKSSLHQPQPSPRKYPYTGILICAKCGKHYRRKITPTQVVWMCATFTTMGKKHCASKQIPESTLNALVTEVVNNPADIKKIIADDGNTLHFHLADDSVVIRTWKDRSRAESWTNEKRELARQKALERSNAKWQKQ